MDVAALQSDDMEHLANLFDGIASISCPGKSFEPELSMLGKGGVVAAKRSFQGEDPSEPRLAP